MRRLIPMFLVLGVVACGSGGALPTAPAPPVAATPSPSPTPAASPAPTPTPPPAPSGVSVLRTAQMRGANGHNASGTVRIVRDGSEFRLEFLGDFRIDGGSNDVYLARSTSLDMSRDLRVSELRSRNGAQTYMLPSDGEAYSFVILWCRPFQIPIGQGQLQ